VQPPPDEDHAWQTAREKVGPRQTVGSATAWFFVAITVVAASRAVDHRLAVARLHSADQLDPGPACQN